MTLGIQREHNLPPHLSYVSTLPVPDITHKKRKVMIKFIRYVVFLSVVWVALKKNRFGVSEVALKKIGYEARSQ